MRVFRWAIIEIVHLAKVVGPCCTLSSGGLSRTIPTKQGLFADYRVHPCPQAKKNAADKKEKTAERSVLHIKDEVDYLGRTYMHPPSDEGKMGKLGVAVLLRVVCTFVNVWARDFAMWQRARTRVATYGTGGHSGVFADWEPLPW